MESVVSETAHGTNVEFVENSDPQGCFGAVLQALTGLDQNAVNEALKAKGLYDPATGLAVVSAGQLTESLADANMPVTLNELLPFFNGFEGDAVALDASTEHVERRIKTLRSELEQANNRGIILAYPCKRTPEQRPFLHFVAVSSVETTENGSVFTIMDPSELLRVDEMVVSPEVLGDRSPAVVERVGGVFRKTEEQMVSMLTPNHEDFIPVFAYSVHIN
jgi:hypothetical protein